MTSSSLLKETALKFILAKQKKDEIPVLFQINIVECKQNFF